MAQTELLKVIARFRDGRMVKGSTFNLNPSMGWFHMIPLGSEAGRPPEQIPLTDLKAVFVVKTFEGNPNYQKKKEFSPTDPGLKLEVVFQDGEVMRGTSLNYEPDTKAFFLIPGDSDCNNKRIFIIREATKSVRLVR